MMAYSRLFNVVLNLIIAVAFVLVFKKMKKLWAKFILLSVAVLVFVLPEVFPVVPFERTWMVFYVMKIGFGIFCLLYVRLKKRT